MANSYTLTIDVDAPVEVTWSVVSDPVGVTRWSTKYVECTLDGDVRTLRNADGGVVVERFLEWSDDERRYRYTVIEGPPLARHEAGFQVVANGAGSTVIWDTDAVFLDESIDTEDRLGPAQREGLERLRTLCESLAASRH